MTPPPPQRVDGDRAGVEVDAGGRARRVVATVAGHGPPPLHVHGVNAGASTAGVPVASVGPHDRHLAGVAAVA